MKHMCMNCGRPVYGFWKYGRHKVCSKLCLRSLIRIGTIPRLKPYTEYPELGIVANKEEAENEV